jgi:hypothetical protein
VISPTGKLIIELREDAVVGAMVGTRVRGPVPAPGDALGPGSYQRFITCALIANPPLKRVPVQRARYLIKCYGTDPTDAMNLYVAASNALHERGVRTYANNIGIWNSWDDTGGSAESDPKTGQPYVSFIVELIATTQAVA